MKARTIKGKSTEIIRTALQDSMSGGFKPTLAIIILTNVENAETLRSLFDSNGIAIFGISTSEKFTGQGMEQEEIIVLLMDIKPQHFKIVLNDYKGSSAYEAAYQAGITAKNTFTNPGFIISSADISMSGEDLISGLTDAAGYNVTVMGGVAGNPADFSGVVFTNDFISKGGLLALVIDEDKVSISGLAVSGWKPAGTIKKITKSEGSWVFTIDDEPAMDVIQKFLGNEIITFDKRSKGLVPLDAGYPLQFQRASGSPMMRPVLLWNTDNKSVLIGGHINEGETFRFSLPPDFDAIDTVVESTKIIKEKNMPDADAMIVFSCIGRLGSFGPMISTEIEGLAATWNKPMVGFFSLGEFGKLDEGRCEFHGTTVSWVAIKEK